ncbi:hypothetical protein TanjilG_19358 [Lupinus angustifolius]|uniref:Uncharacterized protein n=1 Tax=Lupinus angustifolius TaxID=3871 RepID=A0A1J7GRJ9_LUPAN|nr:PREDICTED: uncharacterized protein LOC109358234 [Lupinus angustifolius]OIW03078.1 hypothetical protein TanjilG_19358 [Lupinus angustifolius]
MFFPGAMAVRKQEPHKLRHKKTTSQETISAWQPRHSVPLRRRKVQAIRLGEKKLPRRGMVRRLVRIFGRMRLKWLKLQYVRMLKKLKDHYQNMLKELVEAGNTLETILFTESTNLIPAGGIVISSCPSRYGSNRPRIEKSLHDSNVSKSLIVT